MKHDVFISYSSKDKIVADAVCHVLEQHGIQCWIAPRDVLPGSKYAIEIMRGIEKCRVMVLVYTKASNQSDHVASEIENAFNGGKTIIPFLVDNTPMNKEMCYFLNRRHWLVAYPHYAMQLENLAKAVANVLGIKTNNISLNEEEVNRNDKVERCKGKDEGSHHVEEDGVIPQTESVILDEKKILYEHFIMAENSFGKMGLKLSGVCLLYVVIIGGIVLIWFNPSDFWWFIPTILCFALLSVTYVIMYINYSNLCRRLQLTKEQKEDFTNQYRQETENYNEMIRKKKLDLLSEEELAQLKKIKQSRKNIGGMSNFEGLVNLFFFIAIIVIWYIYW